MTTIERARRYWRRIARWAVMTGAYNQKWDCQARVARALIRQELEKELKAQPSIYKDGLTYGLARSIQILDAVYGREK